MRYLVFFSLAISVFCKPNVDRSLAPYFFSFLNSKKTSDTLSLTYSPNTYSLSQNIPINPITPTVVGTIQSCYLSAFPAGLSIDNACRITGTPISVQPEVNYIVTAINATQTATASLKLSVITLAPTIRYAGSPYSFTINSTITTISPVVSGTLSNFSILPALPSGLSFNTTTGQVSGTPTVLSSSTSYTVTASNADGITTSSFSLAVVEVSPSALSYTGSPFGFPDFVAIGTLTPTITGTPTSCNSAPTLPAGLAISATCVITGTPTTVQASATYTITASNTGGSTSTTIDIAITTFVNKRIFVTGAGYLPGVQFTSPATADTLCNADAAKPSGGGLFKAMIVGLGRVACLLPNCPGGGAEHTNWIFLPSTNYYQPDGVTIIAATNVDGLMPGGFVNPATPNAKYWTGLNTDWTTSINNCGGWTSIGFTVPGGIAPNNTSANFTASAGWGLNTCGAAQQLLCVQQ